MRNGPPNLPAARYRTACRLSACATGFTATTKRVLRVLAGRARSGRPASLGWAGQGKAASRVEEGADPCFRCGTSLTRDGAVRFRRVDGADRIAAGFVIALYGRSVGKLLRRLGCRRLSVRPQHPQTDLKAQETFKKTSLA